MISPSLAVLGANVGEVADQLAASDRPFSAICLDVSVFCVLGRVLSPAGLMGRGKRHKAALRKSGDSLFNNQQTGTGATASIFISWDGQAALFRFGNRD